MPAPPTDLILVRLVTATFTPKLSQPLAWTVEEDGIQARPAQEVDAEGASKWLISAAQELSYFPKVTSEGDVIVPVRERARAERVIESATNVVAVSERCSRAIASPWPPVVLIAQTDKARQWLAERNGLHHRRLPASALRTVDKEPLDAAKLNELADRDDGVALMAEALSTRGATARFHEFVRLFERAFARPSKLLIEPLAGFLATRFGYTQDELHTWFGELRDPATHADTRPTLVFEVDIRPVIARMEQAAYDVLLNKKAWRDPSTDRRELWHPNSGTTNAAGATFIVQHTTPVTQSLLLDEYGTYPMDMAAVINNRPTHWWPQNDAKNSQSSEFPVEIVAADDGSPQA